MNGPLSKVAPTDEQLLNCWFRERMDTAQIARRYDYPEYCVYSRLWRLREAKKQEHESS